MTNDDMGPTSGVTAHITIPDGRAPEAIDFYRRAFGAELAMEPMMGEDGERVMHAHLRLNGGSLMLNDDFPEYGGGRPAPNSAITLHLQVADADLLFNQALQAGATETMKLEDQFWGDRYGQLRDPFGVTWSIGAPAVPKQD